MGEKADYQRLASGEEEEMEGLRRTALASLAGPLPAGARPDVLAVPGQRVSMRWIAVAENLSLPLPPAISPYLSSLSIHLFIDLSSVYNYLAVYHCLSVSVSSISSIYLLYLVVYLSSLVHI